MQLQYFEYLSDKELIDYLKSYWGLEKDEVIEVIGVLHKQDYHNYFYISNVRLKKTLEYIEYPLDDLDIKNTIKYNGIYVSPSLRQDIKSFLTENNNILIKCQLQLAIKEEREKRKNPFLLSVVNKTIEICKSIDEKFIIKNEENVLIPESIFNSIQYEYKEKLDKLNEEFNLKLSEIKQKYIEEEEKLQKKILEKEATLQKLDKKINRREINIEKLEKKKIKITEELKKREKEKNELIQFIEILKYEIEEIEKMGHQKLEKFRSFIKEKADMLLKFEFIDEEEYNDLLMIKQKNNEEIQPFLSFKDDLNSDYQKAISHIQSYLFHKDIIYPRYIIEDFMALIQTNDLIILAGESGAGKTNLIKSFAKAIGGKAFIIPVKPNWTSAEDLLGYYNPIEKKYLTTPFLNILLEAKNNPETPYFICLDEMNLARVEYYFADFLSLLEERSKLPQISLYSDDESSHILSEFKHVLEIIDSVKDKYKKDNLVDFVSLLKDSEVNKELKKVFGFSDKDSLIKYHTDLRKMITGIINIPSSIEFPKNVRIIGAINVDETTHYLSPKILDRAHIMKFYSPLLYDWTSIVDEIEKNDKYDHILKMDIDDLGIREEYPKFNKDDEFCKIIVEFTKKYFHPMGIEVGLRTIRQGLNYKEIFEKQGSNKDLVLNNFVLHKILPKMIFDWNKKVNEDKSKRDLVFEFQKELKKYINTDIQNINVIEELDRMISFAKSNDGIINYWA